MPVRRAHLVGLNARAGLRFTLEGGLIRGDFFIYSGDLRVQLADLAAVPPDVFSFRRPLAGLCRSRLRRACRSESSVRFWTKFIVRSNFFVDGLYGCAGIVTLRNSLRVLRQNWCGKRQRRKRHQREPNPHGISFRPSVWTLGIYHGSVRQFILYDCQRLRGWSDASISRILRNLM